MTFHIPSLVESLYVTGRWRDLEHECRSRLAQAPGDVDAALLLAQIVQALGRPAEARELYRALADGVRSGEIHARLAWALSLAGELDDAIAAFRTAFEIEPTLAGWSDHLDDLLACRDLVDDALARQYHCPDAGAGRYMVSFGRGHGFFSELHNALGYLLVASVTGRQLHVQWGATSLFSEGADDNAFPRLFHLADAPEPGVVEQAALASVFPAGARPGACLDADLATLDPLVKRASAVDLVGTPERVAMGAQYTSVLLARQLLSFGDARLDVPGELLEQAVFAAHVRPAPGLEARADEFVHARLGSGPWLAIHVRGTDKLGEQGGDLPVVNEVIWRETEARMAAEPALRLYLMTDDAGILARYETRYGNRVVVTDALRGSAVGEAVHLAKHLPRRRVGEDVLVDALVALRAPAFLGNRWSNVACGVRTMKAWAPGALTLFGSNDASANFHAYLYRQ